MSKTITIGTKGYEGDDDSILQRAVDDAATAGGGVVEIPAGTYLMHDSLHLRTGVKVLGEEGTVLLKIPSVSSPIADYLGYGHYEVTVADPQRFRVGMGVRIGDDDSFGFYETVATVVGKEGNRLFIDSMLNHDYDPAKDGVVTSVFPIVSGTGIADAAIEGITIDGNPDEAVTLNGCRGGGVYLLQAHGVRVEGVEVRNYNGDAVSFQQCVDILVRRCRLHHNAGGGLHPGSGSVRYLMEENAIEGNGGCGVFYCLRTTHAICRDNHISDNGEAGISIGERDTDHLIEANTITGSGGPGIEFRKPRCHGGDLVLIRSNDLARNCRYKGGYEILVPERLHDIHIIGNSIEVGGEGALFVGPGCSAISFVGNKVSGRDQAPDDVSGERESVSFEAPDDLPPVGPDALPPDGARHLGATWFMVDGPRTISHCPLGPMQVHYSEESHADTRQNPVDRQ